MGVFQIQGLSNDERAVQAEVEAAQAEGREISHACARVIGSWFHDGQASDGYAFVSTGVILPEDSSDLWRELGGALYWGQSGWMQDALNMLGTYLVRRSLDGDAAAIPGWSDLWVW